ncbi:MULTISPECIES: hypothetical protein [unclassified Sphingomonas]|nr:MULTISPECIES: hypothetical protein [unclassified Sphingomonas]
MSTENDVRRIVQDEVCRSMEAYNRLGAFQPIPTEKGDSQRLR